jgi:hypothetical protein
MDFPTNVDMPIKEVYSVYEIDVKDVKFRISFQKYTGIYIILISSQKSTYPSQYYISSKDKMLEYIKVVEKYNAKQLSIDNAHYNNSDDHNRGDKQDFFCPTNIFICHGCSVQTWIRTKEWENGTLEIRQSMEDLGFLYLCFNFVTCITTGSEHIDEYKSDMFKTTLDDLNIDEYIEDHFLHDIQYTHFSCDMYNDEIRCDNEVRYNHSYYCKDCLPSSYINICESCFSLSNLKNVFYWIDYKELVPHDILHKFIHYNDDPKLINKFIIKVDDIDE